MKNILPVQPPRDAKQYEKALRGVFVLAVDLTGNHKEAQRLLTLSLQDTLTIICDLGDGAPDEPLVDGEARDVYTALRAIDGIQRITATIYGLCISVMDGEWSIGKACENCSGRCSCRTRYIIPAWRELRREFARLSSTVRVLEEKLQTVAV